MADDKKMPVDMGEAKPVAVLMKGEKKNNDKILSSHN